jgi:hypothetical protein
MYIAMNRFKVLKDRTSDFESTWLELVECAALTGVALCSCAVRRPTNLRERGTMQS